MFNEYHFQLQKKINSKIFQNNYFFKKKKHEKKSFRSKTVKKKSIVLKNFK